MKNLVVCLVLATGLPLAGCGKKQEPPAPIAPPAAAPAPSIPAPVVPSVGNVTLGNAIDAEKKVATPLESFGVKDKVYASIETVGAGHFRLRALWSFVQDGKTAKVNETTLEFDATGPAWNEFHIENAQEWPKGNYQVEIFLGDAPTPAATRTFRVQ